MNHLSQDIINYLNYCRTQKQLDAKTIKAYRIDLCQFERTITTSLPNITSEILENYISNLHSYYKPRTVKRKLASLKAFFRYLEYKKIISYNPFHQVQVKFREPAILPKTIPLSTIELFLSTIHSQRTLATTSAQRKKALRDAAVIELLFATGIRVSELCALKSSDIDFHEKTILIYGKGSKERRLYLCNDNICAILQEYQKSNHDKIKNSPYFFVNQSGAPLSPQAVRRMINHYCSLASIEMHITPHMFRHTFATSLLEADVDIRYIQEMLGHSSIHVTEIYTHVAIAKQREILSTKHPRLHFHI